MTFMRLAGLAAPALAVLVAAACGGTASGSGVTSPQYGALKMALTDAEGRPAIVLPGDDGGTILLEAAKRRRRKKAGRRKR